MKQESLFFFVGTTAELIKLMPVMGACRREGLAFEIVASGQNDIRQSELLAYCGKTGVDHVLHEGPIRKSAAGLFVWFLKTLLVSAFRLSAIWPRSAHRKRTLVVHGDTVSTVMGALLGRLHGLQVAHVEAGLRSFDYLHPFPEEIDRVITSRLAHVHFCPNAWAVNNLSKRSGVKVDTRHNTLLDALTLAKREREVSPLVQELRREPYFVFVMHRQENLFNRELVRELIAKVTRQSKRHRCVFILHHLTEVTLAELGLLEVIWLEATIRPVKRLPYIEFMQVLASAEYVVTDGGSNQEECYYLGKPCLVLRKVTERTEGLGENVVLSGLDLPTIDRFLQDPMRYSRHPVVAAQSPSSVIVHRLSEMGAS